MDCCCVRLRSHLWRRCSLASEKEEANPRLFQERALLYQAGASPRLRCSPSIQPPNHVASTLQALLLLLIADTVAQLAIQVVRFQGVWYGDFRFWTSVLLILSMLVVFDVQWLEHSRLRHANGVVLFYWLLLIIAMAVKLRSLTSQQVYAKSLPYFVTYCVGFGVTVVEFAVEWLWPRNVGKNGYEAIDDGLDECPVEYANVFSHLTFSWMTPMMKYGYKVFLTEDVLWGLAKSDQTKNTGDALEKAWEHELKHRPKSPSLWLALFRAYGGHYAVGAIFKAGNDISQYIQPQLLRLLISFVASYSTGGERQPIIKGAAIALAMFACAVFQTTMVVSSFSKQCVPF